MNRTTNRPRIVDPPKRSYIPLLLGAGLYGIVTYASYLAYSIYKMPKVAYVDNLNESQPSIYNDIAKQYDSANGPEELLGGIGWLRSWACREASGDILEASCGTGRNMKHYDLKKVKSLTFVDQSSEMLDLAEEKWQKTGSKIPAYFKAQPLEGLSPARDQYDTIIQTFGLCSVSNPSGYLAHLATFARPTGKIILIEHGRSKYDWLNNLLDNTVEKHAAKWGCYNNRDINAIIKAVPGITIDKLKRYHLGTTYVYHLSLKSESI